VRRPRAETLKRARTTARRRQLATWRKAVAAAKAVATPTARVLRRGLDVRMRAWLIVSQPPARVHTMPADVAGHPRTLHVPGSVLRPVMDAWTAGDRESAAEELEDVFLAVYGLPGATLEEVEWCQVNVP